MTVTPVGDTPQVANITTLEDTLSGAIVINRHAADGAEVTHFKISGITGGTLFQNNGTTAIANGDFITFAQANAGLKFTPSANSFATGHFTIQASMSNVDGGLGDAVHVDEERLFVAVAVIPGLEALHFEGFAAEDDVAQC